MSDWVRVGILLGGSRVHLGYGRGVPVHETDIHTIPLSIMSIIYNVNYVHKLLFILVIPVSVRIDTGRFQTHICLEPMGDNLLGLILNSTHKWVRAVVFR